LQRRKQRLLLGQSMASSSSEDHVKDLSEQAPAQDGEQVEESLAVKRNLRPGLVKFSFALIFFLNLIINIDHGVMPAGAIAIKGYLAVSNTEYGLLGSIVFFGLVLGSLAASFVYNMVNTKAVLFAVMSLNALCQVAFTMTTDYQYLVGLRFLTGFF